jgi:uncharacterized membrane protein YhaH (DUF805 family)
LSNPYNAPVADLSKNGGAATYIPEMVAMSGRIGRLRYMCYNFVLTFVCALALGIVAAILAMISPMLAMVAMVLVIPMLGIAFVMAIRRLNDMDRAGWWSLLMFVPVVSLILSLVLLFFPGDKEANSYGPPPAENTTGIKIGAGLMIAMFVLSIVAAVSFMPEYMRTLEAAKEAQAASEQLEAGMQDASE